MKVTYEELRSLISAIENDESRSEVRFGCDCGCGGDYWLDNPHHWGEMVAEAEKAEETLRKMGVVFE